MLKLFNLLLVFPALIFAQTAETHIFRTVLSPANEVPPVDISATGAALIRAHVVRNASGEVVSGTVDFIVDYSFPGAATFTGLHIHTGAAGANGPVVINTGIGGANGNIEDEDGRGNITRSAQISGEGAALTALRGLLDNPSGYYVNLHTTVNPGGVIRGQLQRPQVLTLMTTMSPRNEVPAITTQDQSSGLAAITAMRTFDAAGNMDSALVMFEVDYRFPEMKTMTGLHIHDGLAGANGPVVINTGLASTPTTDSGAGSLRYSVPIDLTRAANVAIIDRLFTFPDQFYVNLHTTEFPGGVIRGQLRRTDRTTFQITLHPANEVPPLTLEAMAPSTAVVQTIRRGDGTVEGGRVTFDVNYRFPGETTFTGLHIHNQVAGQNGPVTINTGLGSPERLESATGFGNIYIPVLVSSTTGLTTLDSVLSSPEKHYMNLHTTVNPGGAVRAQLGEAFTQPPIIGEALSVIVSEEQRAVAPGGLIAIYGRRFAKSTTDIYSWQGSQLPVSLNGASVTIGGQTAPLIMVSPEQINAQVPFEVGAGPQPVVVTNAAGASAGFNVTVQRYAPAIYPFGTAGGGHVFRLNDYTFITPDNPATAGDRLWIFATGLGQTTPPLTTGQVIGDTVHETAAVTATIAGVAAMTVRSTVWSGPPGTYATEIIMPSGVPAGMQPLQLTIGGSSSNTVMLPVR